MKEAYSAPRCLRKVEVQHEGQILAGSVVNSKTKVRTVGQEVETFDFSDPTFNQDWDSQRN